MRSDGKIYLLTSYEPVSLDRVQAVSNIAKAKSMMREAARQNQLTLLPLRRTGEDDWETYPFHIHRVRLLN